MQNRRLKMQKILKELNSLTQEQLKDLQYELGIDQAGRGPVFGSMIYAALWWPIKFKSILIQLGFQDSKILTQEKRQELFELINKLKGKGIFYELRELTAQEISTNMQSIQHHKNLNQLSHKAALQITLKAFKQGYKIRNIYVDTVGDPEKYKLFLKQGLKQYLEIINNIVVQPKADRDHKVVSAASICAKVTRDTIIRNWQFHEKLNFKGQLGSGYPGDPKTKQWLQINKNKIFVYPNLVRYSWQTVINLMKNDILLTMYSDDQMDNLLQMNYFNKQKKYLQKDLYQLVWENNNLFF